MLYPFHHLFADDSGAVSVEWVVLTAIAAAFGYIVSDTLGAGTHAMAVEIQTTFDGMEVAPLQTLGYSD